MHRSRVLRLLAPAAAIIAATALGGCVAYPGPYGYGYGYGGYYGAPYAYAPAPVFGFGFGGWHGRDWR